MIVNTIGSTSFPFLSAAAADTAAVALTDIGPPHNPFHKGEIALQQMAGRGVQESVMSYAPQFIRPFMLDQHREFYADLPFLVAAARDETGAMWATLLENTTSDDNSNDTHFVTSPDKKTLHLQTIPVAGDALEKAFHQNDADTDVGLLGIQFESARRNRVNGRVVASSDSGSLTFTVDQAFGNCPQYIKPRTQWWRVAPTTERSDTPNNKRASKLTEDQIQWVETAETIFTASGYRGEGEDMRYGNDASHRGGQPGFVQVESEDDGQHSIVWTEYKGNNHFNSLGNILLDPRAGITIPNFATGGLLQLTGTAALQMGSLEKGARKVRMLVAAVNELPAGSLPIRWKTDSAEEAQLQMQVLGIVQESENVKSFYLKPADASKSLSSFEAGQHLPVELTLKDGEVINRSYSLSAAPAWAEKGYYRISVKHEARGKSSSFLHTHVKVGDHITVGKPSGSFTREKNVSATQTTVLISAGIGITPVLSMLHEIAAETNTGSTVVWIHGARNGKNHPLQQEVDKVLKEMAHGSIKRHIVYSRPDPNDTGYDFTGHIKADLVGQLVPNLKDAAYYMCGPLSFLADLETGLEALDVDSKNIHFETF